MPYEQVCSIIGSEGEDNGSDVSGGTTSQSYKWNNGDGTSMNALFSNNKLVLKAEWKLKTR